VITPDIPILSILAALPAIGALLLLLLPGKNRNLINMVTVLVTSVTFIISLPLFFEYNPATSGFQYMEHHEWLSQWGISYTLGIDGISMVLIVLTTFISVIAVVSSFTAVEKNYKEYMVLLLLLETGMIGVFAALDLFLFYLFWEAILIPMYLIIGIWGGKNRIYATVKFFLYTLAGSTLMLIAIIYMAFQYKAANGVLSFSLTDLYTLQLTTTQQLWLFGAFALSFAIKVPYFPVHTWLPDAHTEAPTAGSVILAAVLLKMGTYGFIRFNLPLFPEASIELSWLMALFAVIGIVYGAFMALVQEDVKRMVAYSSVSHMGFVMLGLFSWQHEGVSGAILQMINHGVSTGMLFLLVGVIYERRHTRMMSDYGGIAAKMPLFAIMMMIATLSSIGLPGTNGFVGEFLILLGGYLYNPIFGIISASGVIFGALYMLRMYQRVFLGEITKKENEELKDLNFREIAILAPLVVLIFWIGIYPAHVTDKFKLQSDNIVAMNPEATEKREMALVKVDIEQLSTEEAGQFGETTENGDTDHNQGHGAH